MKSRDDELNPLKFLKFLALMVFAAFIHHYYFKPPDLETIQQEATDAEPDADPFPFLSSEEEKEAWRDRHPIKSWTRPYTW